MDNGPEPRESEEKLDRRIDEMLSSNLPSNGVAPPLEQVAQEFARLASEESPRMSNAARTQGLNRLRARAAQKRAAHRPGVFAFLGTVPRWVQVGVIALVVVLIANGVNNAAADSLPGSLFYPFKRFGEGGQLLLQNTNGQRAQLWMDFANTRLDEVQRLLKSGAHVDPSQLDGVDESILRALAELAGTRGDERVELLKKLTQLAVRQQQIVNQLAEGAPAPERARLAKTAKLLAGIASYAQSADAQVGTSAPFEFLTPGATPSAMPTPSVTVTPSGTPTLVATPEPGALPQAASDSTATFTREPSATDRPPTREPDDTETPAPTRRTGETETPGPTDTGEHEETREPTSTREPTEVHTETREPTDTREPTEVRTETREPTDTREPTEARTDTPEPTDTREPTNTRQPTETRQPDNTREPTETPKPDNTREPTETRKPSKTPDD